MFGVQDRTAEKQMLVDFISEMSEKIHFWKESRMRRQESAGRRTQVQAIWVGAVGAPRTSSVDPWFTPLFFYFYIYIYTKKEKFPVIYIEEDKDMTCIVPVQIMWNYSSRCYMVQRVSWKHGQSMGGLGLGGDQGSGSRREVFHSSKCCTIC